MFFKEILRNFLRIGVLKEVHILFTTLFLCELGLGNGGKSCYTHRSSKEEYGPR